MPPGSQRPRLFVIPEYVSTTGRDAVELCAEVGLELDDWQAYVLVNALGERAGDHNWAAKWIGLVVPRQNGKSALAEARILTGLFILEEHTIIYSAHLATTARQIWKRLCNLLHASPYADRIVKMPAGKGAEAIIVRNPETGRECTVEFRTRSGGAGRGYSAPCVFFDEAMVIDEEFNADLVPVVSAQPESQVWYMGSAVDATANDKGVVFTRIRDAALNPDRDPALAKTLAFFEWSVDPSKVAEALRDPEYWAQANPGLGIRISEEYIGSELGILGPAKFAVERLSIGNWPETDPNAARVISPEAWQAVSDPDSKSTLPITIGFDIGPDRQGSISVSGRRTDGRFHVQLVKAKANAPAWMPADLKTLQDRNPRSRIVCSAKPSGAIFPDLDRLGVKYEPLPPSEYASACAFFVDSIAYDRLRHLGHHNQPLTEAVFGSAKHDHNYGETWTWDRRSPVVDLTPLVSGTLALWGASHQQKRAPRVWGSELQDEIRAELEAERAAEARETVVAA